MPLNPARIETLISTVESICASTKMDQHLIGLTKLSALKKGDQYRNPRVGFQHLVFLADRLTKKESEELEATLQQSIMIDGIGPFGHQKYHADKAKNGKLYRSAGGQKDSGKPEYAVYIAWWDK